MELLTSKSIIKCNEKEEQQHIQEMMKLENKLWELDNYDCLIIQKSQDIYHKDQKGELFAYNLHGIYSLAEFVDCKNGADAYIDDNGLLVLSVYGQSYTYENENYLLNSTFCVIPHNEVGTVLDISDFIQNGGVVKETNRNIGDFEKNKSKESTIALLKNYKITVNSQKDQKEKGMVKAEINR